MKSKSPSSLMPVFSSKTVFAIGVAVPFFLYLVAYIINGVFPFGGQLLLEADSFHQYLPFLAEFRRKLVSGGSMFYSFSGGLGYNFLASLAYYAASPLNLLLMLVPESNVCDFMVWMTVLKVSLCGGILAWYLVKQNSGVPFFAIAFGTMYAFSNYLISYKYNFMWLDSIAVVPLVMYGLEKIVRGDHPGWYLFSLFFAIWCNYYIGYIICIFSCLYLIFLLVTEESLDRKAVIRRCCTFAVSSVAAGGMAAILLIPSYLALRQSTAMVTGENSGIQFYNNFLSMFRSHYMESESFRISYNRGDVHLYCGMMVLPLTGLFFSDRTIRKRVRLAYAVFLGFLLLSFTFSPLNFMWHGFHNQTGLPNRFSFLYNILILRLCYSVIPGLKNMEEHRLNKVILGVFAVSGIFAVWDFIAQHSFRVTLSLGFLALYTVLLYEIRSNPKKGKQVALLLCFLMILEAGSYEIIDLSLNGKGWERSYYVGYQKDYQTLLSEQQEKDFFRSDIDTDISNFITYSGGNGVSFFNSTMQDNICRFLGGMNLHTELNTVINTGGTKLLNDILGVRYLITENTDSDTWNGFVKVAGLNGRNLYRNENALSIGFMVPGEFASWTPEPGNGMKGMNDLARITCGIEEMFPLLQVYTGEFLEPYSFEIPQDTTLYVTLDEEPLELSWETPEYSRKYEKWFQYLLLPAQRTEENQQAFLTAASSDIQYTGNVYSCREEDYQRVINALSKNQLENVVVSGNKVSGSVTADQDGILLLTIPYNKGWRIKADGAFVEAQEIGGALIGIPLSKGEHQLEMCYTPQGFSVGCILSLLSLLLTLSVVFFEKWKTWLQQKLKSSAHT